MFLALSDFNVRPYRIPNQQESTDLEDFISDEEERILTDLLGYEMYKEFVANTETSSPDQKWIDLRDGAEYQYNSKTYKYAGIVALLKPAVYSSWIDRVAFKLTNVGFVQNNAPKESTVVDQTVFRVEAWNDYARQVYNCGSMVNTLYGFLTVNEADYDTLCFNPPQTENRFGL